MLAGTLEIQMTLDTAKLRSDIEQAKRMVGDAMGSISGAVGMATRALAALGVGLSAAAFAGFIEGAIDAADHLNKLSQRTGVAIEALSQLQFTAKIADVSADALTTGIKKLNVSIAEGLGGDKAKVEMFRNLGITLTDASGRAKTADKVLLEMAGSFSTAKDGSAKVAYALGLMGKAGDEMIPMLNGGTQAMADMMAKADRLGLTISKEFGWKAEAFNDNLLILRSSSDKLAIALGGGLVDGLGAVAQKMVDATEKGGKLAGIIAGINEVGNQLFNWEAHQEMKPIIALKSDIANLRAQLNAPVGDMFGQMDGIRKKLEEKTVELQTALAKYYRLTDGSAGAGRGSVNPALVKPSQDSELKALTGGGAAADKAKSAVDAIIKSINEKIAADERELKLGRTMTEYEKVETKAMSDLAEVKVAVTEAEKRLVAQRLEKLRVDELAKEQVANEIKGIKELNKFLLDQDAELAADAKARTDERDRVNKSIADQTRALRDNNDMLQLEGSMVGATDRERQIALGNLKIELDLKHQIKALNDNLILGEAERAKAIAEATANANLEKQGVAMRANLDEFQRVWGSIDQTAHDVWVNIFDSGSNVFKKLGQTLKASLLDLLYQMTVKKWIFQIYASITGGASGMAGMAANGVVQGGASSLLGSVGSSMGGSFLGAGASATMQNGLISGFGANMTNIGTLMEGGSYMTALSAAAPYIAAIVAVVALIASSLGGETRSGGQYNNGKLITNPSGGEIGGTAAGDASKITADSINATLAVIGSSSRLTNFMTGVESSTEGKGFAYAGGTLNTGGVFGQGWGASFDKTGNLGYMTNRGDLTPEEAMKKFTTELKQSTLQAIQAATDVPDSIMKLLKGKNFDTMADAELDPILTAVNNVIIGVAQFRAAMELLPFEKLRGQSFDFAASLGDLSGGMDKFLTNLGTYYENFYSPAEQRAQTVRNIANTINAAGGGVTEDQIGSMTRETFRQIVDGIDLSTEAGRTLYAAMMSVSGAFASITPVADAASGAVADVVSHLAELNGATENLRVELLKAQGDTAGAAALQRSIDTAGFAEAEIAIYDYNVALRAQIDAINAAAAAAAAAAAQLEKDRSSAIERLKAAYNAESAEITRQINLYKDASTRMRAFSSDIRTFLTSLVQSDLSPLTPAEKYAQAGATFESTYAKALTGDQGAMAALTGVSQDFLKASQEYNASSDAYRRDFARVQSALTIGAVKADEQAAYAEQQVTLLQQEQGRLDAMVSGLIDVKDAVLTVADAISALGGLAPAGTAQHIQEMYTAMVGSAPTAAMVANFTARVGAGATGADIAHTIMASPDFQAAHPRGGAVASGYLFWPLSEGGTVQEVSMVIDWVNKQLQAGDGMSVYDAFRRAGITMPEVDSMMGWAPGMIEDWATKQGLPLYRFGTNFVPETGLALLHRGEAVIPEGLNSAGANYLQGPNGELPSHMYAGMQWPYDFSKMSPNGRRMIQARIDMALAQQAAYAERLIHAKAYRDGAVTGANYVPSPNGQPNWSGEAVIARLDALADKVAALSQQSAEATRALIQSNYDATDKAASKIVDGSAQVASRARLDREQAARARV
jgi:hypothetical protein